jgi:hypothetical protein
MKLTLKHTIAAILLVLSFAAPVTAISTSALAMDFSILPMPDGLRIVFAKGDIVAGDSDRFRVALQAANRDTFGNKEIALNSGGGLVNEALAMVALMDQEKVTTIVPPGATCASACAQIVFLAGIQRTVLDGGRLGMHTCSINGDSAPLCNQEIAQNALDHGTPYGSVMAFMRFTGPSKMVWLNSKDADCYGLTRWPPGFNRGVQPGDIAPCVRSAINNLTDPSRN